MSSSRRNSKQIFILLVTRFRAFKKNKIFSKMKIFQLFKCFFFMKLKINFHAQLFFPILTSDDASAEHPHKNGHLQNCKK